MLHLMQFQLIEILRKRFVTKVILLQALQITMLTYLLKYTIHLNNIF